MRLLTAFAFRTLLVDSFRQAAFFCCLQYRKAAKENERSYYRYRADRCQYQGTAKSGRHQGQGYADTLGVSTQAVAKWQAGTALPTIDNLVILAVMLDTKIDDILVIA